VQVQVPDRDHLDHSDQGRLMEQVLEQGQGQVNYHTM
jgi:hypothetical protein